MSAEPLRILLIDDDDDDYVQTRALIARLGPEFAHLDRVRTFDQGRAAILQGGYDVYLVDYRLGEKNGLELVRTAAAAGCTAPILLLTGAGDYEVDVAAMRAGAADYLDKAELTGSQLERAIRHAVQHARALAALRESEERFRVLADQAPVLIWMASAGGGCTYFNQRWLDFTGRTLERELGDGWAENIHPDDVRHVLQAYREAFDSRRDYHVEGRLRRFDGQYRWLLATGVPRYEHDGRFAGYIGSCIDITERRKAEAERAEARSDSEIHPINQQLDDRSCCGKLVGRSPPMLAVFQQIRDLALVDSTVLIEGETGTGKELVARAIHAASRRAERPFVAVNCAGLTDSLLGSLLFGHRRGSFTGAVEDQLGLFETADGGTIFLDEIGDIPRSVQTSLLRVLQEREITRLGEVQPRKVDIRVVAATHRNLNFEVEEGRFRPDLLYRVRVARVHLPPLRERREDILVLAEAFLARLRASTGKPVERVSSAALDLLLRYAWPGNVRELQSAIESAVIATRSATIEPRDLPPEVADSPPDGAGSIAGAQDERQKYIAAIERARGNRALAARLLGVSRSTFYRRLSELELDAGS